MKRAKWCRMFFLILLLLLAGRLYYVQILCSHELTAAAWGQQMIPVLQEKSKGTIYDRHMNALTGSKKMYYYLIHKEDISVDALGLLDQIGAEPAGKRGEDCFIYRTDYYSSSVNNLLQKKWNAYGFCVNVRCDENQIAANLITDLDEMYEGMLSCDEPAFYFLGNGAGNFIYGTGMIEGAAVGSGIAPAALITTLDMELQQELEMSFADAGTIGSAVVTDTTTGQVLAMVSSGGNEANLAVEQAYPIGLLYELVKKTARISGIDSKETASILGLGKQVFDAYPGEATGSVKTGKKTTATVVQISQLLITLANQGCTLPLTLVMSNVQEESVPCMEMTGKASAKLSMMQDGLACKPLIDESWAVGYGGATGTYAVIVHLEKGNPKDIYDLIANRL